MRKYAVLGSCSDLFIFSGDYGNPAKPGKKGKADLTDRFYPAYSPGNLLCDLYSAGPFVCKCGAESDGYRTVETDMCTLSKGGR